MAQAIGCSAAACASYFGGRRRLSLDAAIELAGRNDEALAALLDRIQEVRERNAGGAKLPALYVTDHAGTCCASETAQAFARLSAEPRA